MLSKQNALLLILLFCAFDVISSLGVCTCGTTWDCSNLNRTVILGSESCSNAREWNLQGNMLRRLPAISSSTISSIDISNNELGLGIMDSLGYGFTYLKSLDISKNNFTDLSFLSAKSTCGVSHLVASYNTITDLTAIRKCTMITNLVLENNEITSLPAGAFYVDNWNRYLSSVSLAGNPLTFISASAFDSVGALKHLNISNTRISKLSEVVFVKLTALQTLFLNNNQLLQLPDIIFRNLKSLQKLLLNDNQLTELSKNSFQGAAGLQYLDLRRNKLQSFPEEVFRDLTRLQNLLLNENELTELPKSSFKGMVELQYLNLRGNKLQSLPEIIFDDLTTLQSLNLDDNLLEELPSRIFSRLHSLLELSVRNNRLKTFPSLYGPPLQSVLFNNNSISSLDEDAVRSLLRKGFELGDIRENPVTLESTDWINDRIDMKLTWRTNYVCGVVSLLRFEDHGSIEFCAISSKSV